MNFAKAEKELQVRQQELQEKRIQFEHEKQALEASCQELSQVVIRAFCKEIFALFPELESFDWKLQPMGLVGPVIGIFAGLTTDRYYSADDFLEFNNTRLQEIYKKIVGEISLREDEWGLFGMKTIEPAKPGSAVMTTSRSKTQLK